MDRETPENLLDQMQTDSEEPAPVSEPTARLVALADELEALKLLIAEQARELTEHRKRADELANELIPEEMKTVGLVDAKGKGSFSLRSGAKLHLRGKLWAYVLKAKEAEAFAWLRANGHGDLLKVTLNPATLKAWAKEQLEAGNEPPAELFSITPYSSSTIVKKRG